MRLKRFRWMLLIVLKLLGWMVVLQHSLGVSGFVGFGNVVQAVERLRPAVSTSPVTTLMGISLAMPLAAPVLIFHASASLSVALTFPNAIAWAVVVEVLLRRYIDPIFDL